MSDWHDFVAICLDSSANRRALSPCLAPFTRKSRNLGLPTANKFKP